MRSLLPVLVAAIGLVPTAARAAWVENGVPVGGRPGLQSEVQIETDGAGGSFLVWSDRRNGTTNADIYLQHVDPLGTPLWASDGIAVCAAAADQVSPRIAGDGVGGVFVTWADGRSGNQDIYAQRVSGDGTVLWAADGVGLCTISGIQSAPCLTADGTGSAVVAWQDGRSSTTDIFAQKVDGSGAIQWSTNGVPILPRNAVTDESRHRGRRYGGRCSLL
ncbi:MAG: hypothetical protein R3E97_04665 [Candidatus Eisenbacteria bacterium]